MGERKLIRRALQLSWASGNSICPDCVVDVSLKRWIQISASVKSCTLCGRSSAKNIAMKFRDFAKHVYMCLGGKYIDECAFPDLDPFWREYPCLLTTEDVLQREMRNETNRGVVELLGTVLGTEKWIDLDMLEEPLGDRLIDSWEDFCRFIRHQRRFFFVQEYRRRGASFSRDGHALTPSEILQAVGNVVEKFKLITQLRKGTCVFRARRAVKGVRFKTSLDLGPPNEELANKSNRMSPAGIVMFYGSDTPETAIEEIGGRSEPVYVGTFVLEKNIKILDLSCLPPEPSIFSLLSDEEQGGLEFLHHFMSDVSAKIEPNGYEHVAYVPTQVVTEWFRTVFRHDGRRIHGICYPSTQHEGGRSLVLFANQSDLFLPKGVEEMASVGLYPDPIPSLDALFWLLSERDKPWLRLLETKKYPAKPKGQTRRSRERI